MLPTGFLRIPPDNVPLLGRRLKPTRVVFCTSGGIHGWLVLDRLLCCDRIRIVGVVLSSRVLRPGYSPLRGACEQIRTSGVRYALYLWATTGLADALLATSGRGNIRQRSRRAGIPICTTRDINGAEEQRFLRELRPDLLLTAFFNQLVSPPVYAIPSVGAINIHPSLLPDYRGVDPVFFARLRGSPTLGVSVHRLDAGFDTGNLLVTEAVPVIADESVLKTTARLFRRGAERLVDRLDAIIEGVPGSPQTAAGRYDSWPTPGEVAALRRSETALLHPSDLGAIATGRWAGAALLR